MGDEFPGIPDAFRSDGSVAFLYQQMNMLYQRKSDQLREAMDRLRNAVPREEMDSILQENKTIREQLRAMENLNFQIRAEAQTERTALGESNVGLQTRLHETEGLAVAQKDQSKALYDQVQTLQGRVSQLEQALAERDARSQQQVARIAQLEGSLRAAEEAHRREVDGLHLRYQQEIFMIRHLGLDGPGGPSQTHGDHLLR
ncbi:hypothetical protein PAPYR_37 [Paratrimastix pyriformis]|uniref:Uncharacterized protein n=1 Tax=Paratrimastix pyriformis TaxID=342808 RepID=A0ABQ8UWK5_9EUKA|nr:hypothetical protein PAPYR_37 [Paratrimastix pyriformis]